MEMNNLPKSFCPRETAKEKSCKEIGANRKKHLQNLTP